MGINSYGNRNRVAGRDFHEKNVRVDQFIGGDHVSIALPAMPIDDRPLVLAQRKQLNMLVREIVETGQYEGFAIWQRVHAEIGVSSIDEMTVDHYHTALSYLESIRDRFREKEASKALVHLLLKNTQQEMDRHQLIKYCHIHFGTGRLNELTRSQLQQSLSWLDDKQCMQSALTRASDTDQHTTWIQLLREYPAFCSVLFISGSIFTSAIALLVNKII